MKILRAIDKYLLEPQPQRNLAGLPRFLLEFGYFALKEARACLFVWLFFMAVLMVPQTGWWGLPRYDVLLVIALAIQIWMVWSKLETYDELKAVCLFHVVGFALEAFKTVNGMWSYPDFAYTKLLGVPLFVGFMYAAVGSYIIQAWRLFELRIRHHPPYWMATLVAVLIYGNFFSHHYIGDYRWYIGAVAIGLYARTTVIYRPFDRDRRMPLLLSFVLIGFFIWLAEETRNFIAMPKLQNLLIWVEKVSDPIPGDFQSVGKQSLAIAVAYVNANVKTNANATDIANAKTNANANVIAIATT